MERKRARPGSDQASKKVQFSDYAQGPKKKNRSRVEEYKKLPKWQF